MKSHSSGVCAACLASRCNTKWHVHILTQNFIRCQSSQYPNYKIFLLYIVFYDLVIFYIFILFFALFNFYMVYLIFIWSILFLYGLLVYCERLEWVYNIPVNLHHFVPHFAFLKFSCFFSVFASWNQNVSLSKTISKAPERWMDVFPAVC